MGQRVNSKQPKDVGPGPDKYFPEKVHTFFY